MGLRTSLERNAASSATRTCSTASRSSILQAGESVRFNGPASVVNVISRVTGGSSTIDGVIDSRSSMPKANFFLLNPNGLIFGPNAKLDVGGSFYASTADYLRFSDDFQFLTTLSNESTLTVAHPRAFGFLGASSAAISIQGGQLAVDRGQTLALIGHSVKVIAGSLQALDGLIQLTRGRPPGEVAVASVDPAATGVSVPTTGPGDRANALIAIRSGQLTIDGATVASSRTTSANPNRSGIHLEASGTMAVSNAASVESTAADATHGDEITLTAARLDLTNATIKSSTTGDGPGGNIRLQAGQLNFERATITTDAGTRAGSGGDVAIEGATIVANTSTIRSRSFGAAESQGGDISIAATQAVALSATTIASETRSRGTGGELSVSALLLTMGTGATIQSTNIGASRARGGDVKVNVTDLKLAGAARIFSETQSAVAAGAAGNLEITAKGSATIADRAIISSSSISAAPAGTLTAKFGSLTVTSRGRIQTGALEGNGHGNTLTVEADDSILVSDAATISSRAFTEDVSPIAIRARTLHVDNALISTSTSERGHAGDISLDVQNLILTNGGRIVSGTSGSGHAGNISTTQRLASIVMTGNARIESGTTGGGVGGTVDLHPSDLLAIEAGAAISSNTSGTRAGGDINITARHIELRDGATISASSTGTDTALAGNINITFGETLAMDRATIATQSLRADGGNIAIASTGSLLQMLNSQITTSVQSGVGNGGNITLGLQQHPLSFAVLDHSSILAQAFGGNGGNIGIIANVYLASSSSVNASSSLSTPGTIDVQARITDASGSLAELPENVLQAASLLRASCTARTAESRASSLVVAGREGAPPEPGGLLWSPLIAASADAGNVSSDGHEQRLLAQTAALWFGSNCTH